jgi:hypothetical protein
LVAAAGLPEPVEPWGIGRRVCEHGSAPCDQWERLTAEPCRRL